MSMATLRPVSKTEKIIFPIAVTTLVGLILPSTVPLLGMLMFGNLMKESGVVEGDASIKKEGSTFRWWIFIVIPVGIIAGLVLLVLCIRAYNIRKYRRLRRHRHYQKLKRE